MEPRHPSVPCLPTPEGSGVALKQACSHPKSKRGLMKSVSLSLVSALLSVDTGRRKGKDSAAWRKGWLR